MTAQEFTLNSEHCKSIRTLLREAAEKQIKAEELLQTAGDKYENVLVIMKESGVPWGLVTRTIQTQVFTDWPVKDSGLPRGYQDLMTEGYKPALYLNRFIAWRDKYYRAPQAGETFGMKKEAAERPPKMADLTPEQKQERRIEESKKNTERRISAPHVINRDLVRHAFHELYTFAEVLGNKEAQKHLLNAFKAFGKLFEGETLGTLKEVVQTPAGEMVVQPEPPTQQVANLH